MSSIESLQVSSFSEMFRLEPVLPLASASDRQGGDLFRGRHLPFSSRHLYGGQMVSQAMIAAQATVSGQALQSLHSYFLEPGDKKKPVDYQVKRIRNGRTFSTRQITALQEGKAIFEMLAMFQQDGHNAYAHQVALPDLPSPDDLLTEEALRAQWLEEGEAQLLKLLGLPAMSDALRSSFLAQRPVDIRHIDPVNPLSADLPSTSDETPDEALMRRRYWFRFRSPEVSPNVALGELRADERLIYIKAAIAYISDYGLMGVSMKPHGLSYFDRTIKSTSLDHSVWFHRPADLSNWMLYDTHTTNLEGERGLSFGKIFDQSGALIASTSQEGLIRVRGGASPLSVTNAQQ